VTVQQLLYKASQSATWTSYLPMLQKLDLQFQKPCSLLAMMASPGNKSCLHATQTNELFLWFNT